MITKQSLYTLFITLFCITVFSINASAELISISCETTSDVRIELSYKSGTPVVFSTDLEGSRNYPATGYPEETDFYSAVMLSTCQDGYAKIDIPTGVASYSLRLLGASNLVYYSALMGLAGITCGGIFVKGIMDAYLN